MVATAAANGTIASLTGAMNPGRMNFDYELSGGRLTGFRPSTIFDDGHHTYIQLPSGTAAVDAPAFLARTQTGDEAILNYRMNGSWIIVDGLFERGELVTGVGRSRKLGVSVTRPTGKRSSRAGTPLKWSRSACDRNTSSIRRTPRCQRYGATVRRTASGPSVVPASYRMTRPSGGSITTHPPWPT